MRKITFLAISTLAFASLAACGPQPDPCIGAQDVVTCKAASGGNSNDALMAGALGYAIGSMGSGSGRSTHTQTVIRERTVYKPATSYRRNSYSSSYRSSGFRSSGFRSGGFGRRR